MDALISAQPFGGGNLSAAVSPPLLSTVSNNVKESGVGKKHAIWIGAAFFSF